MLLLPSREEVGRRGCISAIAAHFPPHPNPLPRGEREFLSPLPQAGEGTSSREKED
jgi:hypothetical protein